MRTVILARPDAAVPTDLVRRPDPAASAAALATAAGAVAWLFPTWPIVLPVLVLSRLGLGRTATFALAAACVPACALVARLSTVRPHDAPLLGAALSACAVPGGLGGAALGKACRLAPGAGRAALAGVVLCVLSAGGLAAREAASDASREASWRLWAARGDAIDMALAHRAFDPSFDLDAAVYPAEKAAVEDDGVPRRHLATLAAFRAHEAARRACEAIPGGDRAACDVDDPVR